MLFTHQEISDHAIIKTGRMKRLNIDDKFSGETVQFPWLALPSRMALGTNPRVFKSSKNATRFAIGRSRVAGGTYRITRARRSPARPSTWLTQDLMASFTESSESFGRLCRDAWTFADDEIADNQIIQTRCIERLNRVFGRANDRVAFKIERRVHYHGDTGKPVELLQ